MTAAERIRPNESNPQPASTEQRTSVLVVDDDQDMCELADAGLTQRGYSVTWHTVPQDALVAVENREFDVMLVDIHMDGMSGLELCREALAKRPDLVVVVMTGFGSLDHAIGAMRAGAYDFVTKPISVDALSLAIARASRHRAMTKELKWLREHVGNQQLPNVVGDSPAMRRVADVVDRVAATETNVLITGESGTGKELIAQALHQQSGRTGPFLAINCAAFPETLLESELFGHAKGAFTDARSARSGLFVEAHGGTLFLDEIGDMPLGMQAKLLRALQERKVRPLGSNHEVSFDARLVAATNQDLDAKVSEGKFREDLYYRINVVRVDLPALRERGNDILVLAQQFLERVARKNQKKVTGLGRLVAQRLMDYDWPGNVRELENCIERAVALARFNELTPDDLPRKVRDHRPSDVFGSSQTANDLPKLKVIEERYIKKVLSAVDGNKTMAARVLGLDRRTLYRKLNRAEQQTKTASAAEAPTGSSLTT